MLQSAEMRERGEITSLTKLYGDPELNQRQQELVNNLWIRHGGDFQAYKQALKHGDWAKARQLGKIGPIVLVEKWVLENAVIRGLTVTEMLRLLIIANTG